MSDTTIQPVKLTEMASYNGTFKAFYETGENWTSPRMSEAETANDQPNQYKQGFADGEKAAREKFAVEREQLMVLISRAEALRPEASDELAILIGETVETLVKQIVGDFTPDAEWLTNRIEKAVGMIADCDAARTVWMHPDDIALLAKDTIKLPLMADDKAERGSLRIDCSTGWIENGNALYLEELRNELGLKGGPS